LKLPDFLESGCTTFATPMLQVALPAGISPKVVSERLGHASAAFTLQV
jgi:hypothetical protein